jgi:hypothetical protein
LGALLAMTQIVSRIWAVSDGEKIVATQVMPGPGKDVLSRRRAQVTGPVNFSPGDAAQIAGFRFVTYTQATAVAQLVSRSPDGGLQSFTYTVMWQGGDWKLEVQPSGSVSTPPQEISSLDGFVAWGGV